MSGPYLTKIDRLAREIAMLREAIDIALANTQLAENPVAIAALAKAKNSESAL